MNTSSAINTARDTAENFKETAADTYNKAKDSASDALGKAKDTASDAYGKAKDTASDAYNKAKNVAGDTYEDLKKAATEHVFDPMAEKSRQLASAAQEGYKHLSEVSRRELANVEDWASNNPARAAGVAFGVGLLLGILLIRR